ncbi:hypothetical protein [Nonomuraea sp. NPDC050691]|uniref:hypothetical protein n=1 Tax=Nonomuraea sp. NPDC050691 TaxID=3155661 RepID=UPI0033DE8A01
MPATKSGPASRGRCTTWSLDRSRVLGIAVNRHDEGERPTLPPTTERTAYRVVQETLTNVYKHAGGAETEVHIRYGTAELNFSSTGLG